MTVNAARPTDLDQLTAWIAERCADGTGREPKQSGTSWSCRCPAHEDRSPSLSVSPGTHQDGAVVIHCHAGCDPDAVLAAAHLDPRDLFVPTDLPAIAPRVTTLHTPTPPATYTYTDAHGTPIGQVVRTADKRFWQKRPNGAGSWESGGFGRHLYQLPEVLAKVHAGKTVVIVEGEKDADRLAAVGVVATCNVGGAGKWSDDLTGHLEGADVLILPDNDRPGREHAHAVVASLLQRDAGTVKVLNLPGLGPKGDVADWLDDGGTPEQLAQLAAATPTSHTAAVPDDEDLEDDDPYDLAWKPVDLTGYLDGTHQPPTPAFLTRTDGDCLVYPGLTHSLFGPPESGKTWIALAAGAEVLMQGLDLMYLDFENSPGDIVRKLLMMGATVDRIRDGLVYLQPDRPLTPDDGASLHELVTARPIGLAVIDGVTNVLGLHGLDGNSNADVASYDRLLPGAIAKLGPAVLQVDHTAKSTDDGNRYAIGAQHKLGSITGAAYLVKVDRQHPFAPGKRGTAQLQIAKDRQGAVRGHSGGSNDAGTFVLDSSGEAVEAYIEPPDTGPFRPTVYMGRVSEFLADWMGETGPTKRQIEAGVTGKDAVVSAAVGVLIKEGYVSVDRTSSGHFHRLLRPFSEVTTL